MKKTLSGIICLVMALSFAVAPMKASAITTTSSNEAQIQVLLKLLATLQAMLLELQAQNGTGGVSASTQKSSDSQRMIGDRTADMTMDIYTDFQTPFGARWYNETLSQIKRNYTDTGYLNIIFRHFPLEALFSNSMDRAIASECAAQQGKFFRMVDWFYADIDTEYSREDFKDIAGEIGLNVKTFDACLTNPATKKIIEADYDRGISKNIQGIPTFFVESETINGAQPYSAFEQILDSLLGDSEGGAENADISVEFLSDNVTYYPDDEMAVYKIRLKVSAEDADARIATDQFGFFEEEDGSIIAGRGLFDVITSADIENDLYVVSEDESETFTLEGKYWPSETGTYKMRMNEFKYFTNDGDELRTVPLSPDYYETRYSYISVE